MNDEEIKLHQEIATKNSNTAMKVADDTRNELLKRMAHLEMVVATHEQQIVNLQQKYNIMLTARFDGKSTSGTVN